MGWIESNQLEIKLIEINKQVNGMTNGDYGGRGTIINSILAGSLEMEILILSLL